MVKFRVTAAKTYFRSEDDEDLETMFRCLRVKTKENWFRTRAVLKHSAYIYNLPEDEQDEEREKIIENSQYVKFYDLRTYSFLSGLLPRVRKFLKKKHIKFKVIDERKPIPPFNISFKKLPFDGIEDRPEQVDAVKAALEKGRGILGCATNAGKTLISASIIAKVQPKRVLYLVHRVGLVDQAAATFEKLLTLKVTKIGSGKKAVPKQGIIVSTTQTAANLVESEDSEFLNFLDECDVFIADELHINKAGQATRVANKCSAPFRFGLSGTIREKSKIKMRHYVGMFGPILYRITNKQLVEEGRSARPYIRFVEVDAPEIRGVGFAEAYRQGIVECKERNRAVVREALRYMRKDLPLLIMVSRINHGRCLTKRLKRKVGVPVEFLWGNTPQKKREIVIRKFKQGKVSAIVSSPIFDVGQDIPIIGACVMAGSGKGWELVIQRLGRVLRRKKGSNKVYVTDFIDKHNHHLFKHSLARLRHFRREKIANFTFVQ